MRRHQAEAAARTPSLLFPSSLPLLTRPAATLGLHFVASTTKDADADEDGDGDWGKKAISAKKMKILSEKNERIAGYKNLS